MDSMANKVFQYTGPQLIALFVGLFVFMMVVLIAVLKDEQENKNARIKRPENEWLFTRWDEKLYDCFLSKRKPEEVLSKLGVDIELYNKNCEVIKKEETNFKKLAADKVIGAVLMFIGLLMIIIADVSGIIFSLVFLFYGFILYQGDVNKIAKQAKEKKIQLTSELPRFLDLLQTALYIEIPVSDAISITAQHLRGTLVAEELMASMAETQMGSVSWQRSLQNIATRYDVDVFSDFVQYLINGYEKGLSIYDVVSRQAEETRQYSLVTAEENANKMSSSILIPIAIFKLFPLIGIVAYPLLKQLLSSQTLF